MSSASAPAKTKTKGGSDDAKKSSKSSTNANTPGGSPKKKSDKDTIDALLSLGSGPNNPDEAGAEGTRGGGDAPAVHANAKKAKANGNEKENHQDIWYWLPADQKEVGELDVLCGRGGESNTSRGNIKYRSVVNEHKDAYRKIPVKERKNKTAFVQSIVDHVHGYGGKFVDYDKDRKQYFVVTMARARRKTSQALRETKELKWLGNGNEKPKSEGTKKRKAKKEEKGEGEENPPRNTKLRSGVICSYCHQPGHKTKAAKACLKHHEWVSTARSVTTTSKKTPIPRNVMDMIQQTARAALPPEQQRLLDQYHQQQKQEQNQDQSSLQV